MWTCFICRNENADDNAVKCRHSGTPRLISFKNIEELGDPFFIKFDIKGLLLELKVKCKDKRLHQETINYYSGWRSKLEQFWKEYRSLDMLIRRGEFAAADAVLQRWEGKLGMGKFQQKLVEKRREVKAFEKELLEKSKKERRLNRLLLLGFYSAAFVCFLGLPYLRFKGLESDAERLVRDGRLAEAVQSYEKLWTTTGNEAFRERGSAAWKRLQERKEKAERLFREAASLYETSDLRGASAGIDECITLSAKGEYLELKIRIEEGLLADEIENRKHVSRKRREGMTGLEKKAVSRPEVNRKGQLMGWTKKTPMVLVPAGEFTPIPIGDADDVAVRPLIWLDDFWIGIAQVTNAQFAAFSKYMPRDLGSWTPGADPDAPAVNVSWDMADAYCEWLTRIAGLDPRGSSRFRLPTEAQWEKAAGLDRVGMASLRWKIEWGTVGADLDHGNAYGLLGMLDGVQECCYDFYDSAYYAGREHRDPSGPGRGNYSDMVVRGGFVTATNIAPFHFIRGHASMATSFSSGEIGFRVVLWLK